MGVDAASIAADTCAGDMAGVTPRRRAATPATWGDAIDVPVITDEAVSELKEADVIDEPGA